MESFIFFLKVIAILGGLTILVALHEFGHLIAAKLSKVKVTDYFIGFGPKLLTFKKGETTYGIAAIPAGGYVKLAGSDILESDQQDAGEDSLLKASLSRKLFILVMGSAMNIIAAFLIMAIFFGFNGIRKPTNVVAQTVKGTPAYSVLKAGDKIIQINGQKIKGWNELQALIQKNPGKKTFLKIIRNGDLKQLALKTDVRNNKGFIGIYPSDVRVRKLSITESSKTSANFMYVVIKKTYGLLFKALTGQPSQLVKNSSSMVGAIYVGAKISTSFLDYISFIGYISLILAIINLLPIPPLDAGRAFLFVIEKIKGSPIRKNVLIAINALGLSLLLSLFIFLVARELLFGFPNV